MEAPTRTHIKAIKDACNRMMVLTYGMSEATINDSFNADYAIELRRRVEDVVKHLEKGHT